MGLLGPIAQHTLAQLFIQVKRGSGRKNASNFRAHLPPTKRAGSKRKDHSPRHGTYQWRARCSGHGHSQLMYGISSRDQDVLNPLDNNGRWKKRITNLISTTPSDGARVLAVMRVVLSNETFCRASTHLPRHLWLIYRHLDSSNAALIELLCH